MPGAFIKEIYSSKLVLKDVVSGSRNVTKSHWALQFDLTDDPSGKV